MPIIYCVIARSRTVLAEYSVSRTGNVPVVAKDILGKMPDFDTKKTYTAEGVCFHVLVQNGITYLCVADLDFGASKPFAFLQNISSDFSTRYGDRALTAQAYEMNNDFSRILGKQMEFYSSDPNSDRVTRVRAQIDEVKSVMVNSIEKVLERGDRIEELVDKTTQMETQSFQFKSTARQMKNHLWWKNCKLWVFIIIIVVIILYFVITGFACGGPHLPNCIGNGSNNNNNATAPVAPLNPAAAPITIPIPVPVAPPVAPPVPIPVAPPVAAPVMPPVAVPVAAPIAAPVAVPVAAPVAEPVFAPVEMPIAAPTEVPIAAPVVVVEAPVDVPASSPVAEPVVAPPST